MLDGYSQPTFTSYYDQIDDENVKNILERNALTLSANYISEDYDYNSRHFFTKKLTANIVLPQEIREIAKSVFVAFKLQDGPVMYDRAMDWTDISETSTSGNIIKINVNLDDLDTITFKRDDFESLIQNEYGNSFAGALYIELEDGKVVPVSNTAWLYLQKNNTEGKKSHLTNLYYVEYPYNGYANMYELLQKVFPKLQKKYGSTAKYLAALEKAMGKIDEKVEKITAIQNAMVESIHTEEDFAGKVKDFGTYMEKLNLYNDLKYNIGTEIKTKQSEGIIEEIFGDDLK